MISATDNGNSMIPEFGIILLADKRAALPGVKSAKKYPFFHFSLFLSPIHTQIDTLTTEKDFHRKNSEKKRWKE